MRFGSIVGALAAVLSASLWGASTVKAADMIPVKAPAGSGYIPAEFSWTGYYIGVAAGWGTGKANFTDPLPGANFATSRASTSGGLAGGVTGINYQVGSLVFGFEGDFLASWVKGSVADTAPNTLENELTWTSTVALRAGWAWDRWMIYAKGGGAFANERDTITTPALTGVQGSTYRSGWNVGGGVEWAFTEHWIARFAYDYLKFVGAGVTFGGNVVGATTVNGGVSPAVNEFKGVLEYKF